MKRACLFVFAFFLFRFSSFAQSNPEWNAAQIRQQLEKLNTLGRVLYIAAHPDDENTRLLAWLSNDKKYRTAYLSLTRGDGGQNLVGKEQGPYLGLIRTEELLAARHIDGAEQFFSHALDFGFSKTAKETFDFWGHQRILADVVWIIRQFRPDVIICRFPEDKRAGHGNHWASAILAHEAYTAAADPSKFPQQLRYVDPWQTKRILWNTFNFGGRNTTTPDQLKIDVGGYNPLLGKGYGEIAAESRSMHKSQGFGVSPSYGSHWEYFKTIAGPEPQHTIMEGINTSWSRLKGGEAIQTLIQKTLQQYNMDHPEKIVSSLLKIKEAIGKIADTSWRNQKEKEVNRLILACSGILLNAYSSQPYIVAGQKLKIQTEAINRSHLPVTLQTATVINKKETPEQKLSRNKLYKNTYEVTVPANTPISQPYWLLTRHPAGYYKIPDQRLVGKPENPPALTVQFELNISGQPLTIIRPVRYKYTDPVRGAITRPLVVAPAVTANIQENVYLFTSQKPQQIEVRLESFKDNVRGVVHLETSSDFIVKNNDQPFSIRYSGNETVLYFTVSPAQTVSASSKGAFRVQVKTDEKDYNRGIKIISHNYIPVITVFPFAEATGVIVPLKTSMDAGNKTAKIGYIMGAGDKVPQALQQVGYQVKLLNDQELSNANFHQFTAIVVGIRAYNTRERLKYVQDHLMNYVKNGGTLVVQYNKNFGLVTDHLGPYPFKVTRDRVTDETANVDFLLPDDPILNYPNKITEADFKGWIQERGVYFVSDVDSHYRKPLAMHDPGERVLDGSLIVCKYGKGKYVYTGLDFFRELPAGIPGAFRLFVNLITGK